ncbi:MAG: DUF4129 domain-containing protein [Halobacteriales archaeon]|nr:DUF4129 domain-containing protein [Halobacteriales archaeon]
MYSVLVNIQGLLTVAVAAACILSVGVVSTSLDAVETDPSDVIDTSWIPTQDNQPTSGGAGLTEGNEESAEIEQTQGSPEDTMDVSAGDVETTIMGGGEKALTWWQRLLNLLREYMWHILGGLAAVVALVVSYVVYKRRFAGTSSKNPTIIYDVDTSNDVYKSWWEMVEMLDTEDMATKTPQEFAEIAVEEGFNPDAVTELTDVFEESLYGGREVTREQEKRARDAVEKLKAEGRKKNRNKVV